MTTDNDMQIFGHVGTQGKAIEAEAVLYLNFKTGLYKLVDSANQVRGYGHLHDIHCSPRIADIKRHLDLIDDLYFQTADNDQVDALIAKSPGTHGGRLDGLLHKFEANFFRFTLIGLILTSLVGFGLFQLYKHAPYYLAYASSDQLIDYISQPTESYFLEELAQTDLSQTRQQEIQALLPPLTAHAAPAPTIYKLHIRKGGDFLGANAIALPNGSLLITDELIELSTDPRQIQAVLAHEIAHVEQRHGLQSLYRSLGALAVANLILSGGADLLLEIASLGVVIDSLSYSRQHETQADQRGFELLTKLDISTKHFADIMQKMARKTPFDSSDTSWMSSHPLTKDRIEKALSYENAQ